MITVIPVGAVTEISRFSARTDTVAGVEWYDSRLWVTLTDPAAWVDVYYENGTLERSINVSTITTPSGIVHDGTYLWIINAANGVMYQVNATDGTIITTFSVGAGWWHLAHDGTHLWMTYPGAGAVRQIDTAGNIISELSITNPSSIVHNVSAAGVSYLYIIDIITGDINKVTETGTVVGVYDAPYDNPKGMGIDNNRYFWVGMDGAPDVIIQIDIGIVEVTKTYISTDKTTYLRGETVTLDWYIVGYDPNKRYYYEIWKEGAVAFSEHKEYATQSNTDTWVAAMEGLYVADIQQERFLYPDLKLASTDFTVLSSNVTPAGDITVAPTTINKGESVTITYNLTTAGKIKVYEDVMNTTIYDFDVPSGTLLTRTLTMTTAGNYTAELGGYIFDRVELVDSAAFVVTETPGHPPYVYVDKLTYMLGDTVNVRIFTDNTTGILRLEMVPLVNETSEFVMYVETLTPDTNILYRSIVIPKNVPYGAYHANLTVTGTSYYAKFDISGDKDNYVFWLSNTFYLKDGTSTLVFRQHHKRDVVITVGYSDFAEDELNRTYAEIHRTDLKADEKTYSDIAIVTDRIGLYKVEMFKSRFLMGMMIYDRANLFTFDVCRVVTDLLTPVEVSLIEQVTNPLERIFGEDLGKGIFAFLVIAAIVGVMALERVPTAPMTMVAVGLVLMFSWMGWLPLYITILIIVIGAFNFAKTAREYI